MDNQDSQTSFNSIQIIKIALITVGSVFILAGAVLTAYRFSQTKKSDIVLPGGVTYLGATPTLAVEPTAVPAKFIASATVPYKEKTGVNYPFSFSYPETLPLVVFTNDPTDSVAIDWANIPPQNNILFNIELIEKRDKSMIGKPKMEYVRNWWQYFSGLKGVNSVTPFTNLGGLKGYRAQYINNAGTAPNADIFFEVPGRNDIMIHLANGILDESIFERIVDSLKWISPTSTPKK